jgi:hypothetical protein
MKEIIFKFILKKRRSRPYSVLLVLISGRTLCVSQAELIRTAMDALFSKSVTRLLFWNPIFTPPVPLASIKSSFYDTTASGVGEESTLLLMFHDTLGYFFKKLPMKGMRKR